MTIVPDGERPAHPLHNVRIVLRKDLRLFTRGDALVTLGAYLLVSLQFVRYDEVFFWLSVLLAGALVVVVPFAEWLFDTEVMLGSLPVRRATVVVARYVAAVAACGVAAVVWIASGRVLAPLLAPERTGPAMWTTFEGVLAFLAVTTGLTAIFLPLYFRWALGRAAVAFSLVCFVLLALASAAAPAAGAAPLEGIPFAPPGALVSHGLDALVAAAGPLPAAALIVGGLGAMLSASCWLSVRGFERRDL